jgi:hypothetical protein
MMIELIVHINVIIVIVIMVLVRASKAKCFNSWIVTTAWTSTVITQLLVVVVVLLLLLLLLLLALALAVQEELHMVPMSHWWFDNVCKHRRSRSVLFVLQSTSELRIGLLLFCW